MNEPMKPQGFTTYVGHSSRLIRARRYFIEFYLRRHGFTDVHSKAGHDSFLFSMTVDGQTYWLQVSEAWMVSSTHARVEERLDELQAAILRVKLKHLEAWTNQRIALADRYNEAFKDLCIDLPIAAPHIRHVYHLYTIVAE